MAVGIAASATSKWHTTIHSLVYATYLVIFLSLVIFSILSILYMYTPTPSQRLEPKHFQSSNLTAAEVACAFSGSGQYGITLQSTYYLLLVLIVVLRRQQWLAAGIAASALTYSGVAAIHLGVLLVAYGRSTRSWPCYNDDINFLRNGLYDRLPICSGVYDPDYSLACTVVGAGLLAALPMAMWSNTFKNAAARPTLVMWTLLLAFGHIFYNLIATDEHRHYQICPTGAIEPLPGDDYIAPKFDADWVAKFRSIAAGSMLPQAKEFGDSCIYSCFASNAHVGRKPSEIGVYPTHILETERDTHSRRLGIIFWLLYVVLSVAAVFVERRPWSTCQRSPVYNFGRRATQVISVVSYLGYVIWNGVRMMETPQSEGFTSVGQWSVVAICVMVVVAALAGRVVYFIDTQIFAAADPLEGKSEDWSDEIGYAS